MTKQLVKLHEVTPETAIERLRETLFPMLAYGAKSRGELDEIGAPLDTKRFLLGFGLLEKKVDPKGKRVGYRFPKDTEGRTLNLPEEEFKLIMLQWPTYGITGDASRMFSWCLGLGRTALDPEHGIVQGYWRNGSGPAVFQHTRDTNEAGNQKKFPLFSPVYQGNEQTCWAFFHLMFPKEGSPFLGVSQIQNEQLTVDGDVIKDIVRLRNLHAAEKNLRRRYERMIGSINSPDDIKNMFAYPNRALLLPLVGLNVAEGLGVGTFALDVDQEAPRDIYVQSFHLLKKCKTRVNVVLWDDLRRRTDNLFK